MIPGLIYDIHYAIHLHIKANDLCRISHLRTWAHNDKVFSGFDAIFSASPHALSPILPPALWALPFYNPSIWYEAYSMHMYISIAFQNPLLIRFSFFVDFAVANMHMNHMNCKITFFYLVYRPVMWEKLPHHTQHLDFNNEIHTTDLCNRNTFFIVTTKNEYKMPLFICICTSAYHMFTLANFAA